MLLPLEGVKVLDLSRILAGPHASQTLSDMGAHVTKIEAPWGDDSRTWGPPFQAGFDGEEVASYFLSCNRGKDILFANIKEERDRVRALIEESDVVIENFRPGTFDRLLGPFRSDLIVCSISGYGQNGPRRDEPAFDLTMQARSGIMSVTGEEGGPPAKVGVAWIDVMSGMNAVSSILACLLRREKTGQGARIDISLWDTAMASLVNQGHNALVGMKTNRMGTRHPNLVPYRVFRVSDGWFAIGVGTSGQWERLVEALSLDSPESWIENSVRIENRDLVESMVHDSIKRLTRADLEECLVGVPCASVNTISEALNDPQSHFRENVTDYNGVPTLASPFRFISSSE
ncbi:MAG: CoA transferase [Euryarchaeota archaeon]|nr:CoA transferase [Euryarchaeota archaeon]MAU85447.1 CoA transferase [Euryarchaeota archaeon]|tara:strand:- start:1606 stop:2640 length:1035 start_codon:yes stop_codon:yes gene_type:complete